MNLYLRLLWTLFRARWLDKMTHEQILERTFRVLPNDLDINGHMNNGRYLTLIDLMLVEYFARIGFLKILMQQKWRPMSGGAVVTYRKGLSAFQKYRVRYWWTGSNEHWNFMRFEFLTMEGKLCAAGYMKGAAVSKEGLVRNKDSFNLMGLTVKDAPLPEAVSHWLASEHAVIG